MENKLKSNLVFPDLSYKIIGAAFKVFNTLGWGLSEKHYQKALAKELENVGLRFEREVYFPLSYSGSKIGSYFADFVVEKSVIIELKIVSKLGYANVNQVLSYLKSSGVKLGILIYFTKDGIKYRRVLNSNV